ncbi:MULTISPECIES: acyltransferase [unclassified Butyricimonas]|uniref:acyltransferase n=1 Tax=unclassified Butyricimonas TaxID=2637652 RepID=UPI000C0878BF|nr:MULTISPECIES: acyltransferase [unclassified Butyricimonas]
MKRKSLKIKMLNSSIYPIITKMYRLLGLKRKIRGARNVLEINSGVLFRKSLILVKGDNNKIRIGHRCRFRNLVVEIYGNDNELFLDERVLFYEKGYISIKGNNCKCRLGCQTTVGSASLFLEESDTEITIGKDCMLGRRVSLSTTDFHSIIDINNGNRINRAASVAIGDHVWIGTGVDIEKDVNIANDCVVGAHAVVTKKFLDEHIVIAGVPAKIVKTGISWSREKLE